MNKMIYRYGCIVILVMIHFSCGKEFLNKRQIKNQRVPETIGDFALFVEGEYYGKSSYQLAIGGADEFLVTQSRYNSLVTSNPIMIAIYNWASELDWNLYDNRIFDWADAYAHILRMNIALEGLSNLQPSSGELALYDVSRGMALFHRAHRYFQLAQTYALPYESDQDSPYGLPLRLSDDVTLRVARSSVHQTYDRILTDLHEAVGLLPRERNKQQFYRPFKVAGYGLLANVYLTMGNHEKAASYADSALMLNPDLVDYNMVGADDPVNQYTFHFPNDNKGADNPEIDFYTVCPINSSSHPQLTSGNNAGINPDFVELFEDTDLRKKVNFKPNSATSTVLNYKGSFGWANNAFVGFSSGENYVVAAESYARIGELDKALDRLNTLRESRFRTGHFTPVTERDPDKLLRFILDERKRELYGRGRRWNDLRRLNKDPRFAETLVRELPDGRRIELPPNDVRYTWPIPDTEIQLGRIPQNPR